VGREIVKERKEKEEEREEEKRKQRMAVFIGNPCQGVD
jgi:hypothetical protein